MDGDEDMNFCCLRLDEKDMWRKEVHLHLRSPEITIRGAGVAHLLQTSNAHKVFDEMRKRLPALPACYCARCEQRAHVFFKPRAANSSIRVPARAANELGVFGDAIEDVALTWSTPDYRVCKTSGRDCGLNRDSQIVCSDPKAKRKVANAISHHLSVPTNIRFTREEHFISRSFSSQPSSLIFTSPSSSQSLKTHRLVPA
ncbi:unnamed protein product [Prunus armeniaca]|uniref:Uncharacterized protein n=1 Tax=Prunus armeniaca TaxID=36596 RepID=A0A6J5UZ15_PRUAR|nr:unnamed protein product [Prunus armeniaca]CAB4312188.1 unnamed protein product [Prunus armeniaca]